MKYKVFYLGKNVDDFDTIEQALKYIMKEVEDSKEDNTRLFLEHFEIYQVVFSLDKK